MQNVNILGVTYHTWSQSVETLKKKYRCWQLQISVTFSFEARESVRYLFVESPSQNILLFRCQPATCMQL